MIVVDTGVLYAAADEDDDVDFSSADSVRSGATLKYLAGWTHPGLRCGQQTFVDVKIVTKRFLATRSGIVWAVRRSTREDPDDELFEAIREEYPPVLTTAQVGELLHVGPRTVLAMAVDGRLRASRLPGTRQYNFFREDVIRVLRANLVGPGDVDVDEPGEEVGAPKAQAGRRRG